MPIPGTWIKGFHGVLQRSGLGGEGSVSLRALALEHRSLGTQSMSVLTELPGRERTRGAPRGADGYRPVGAVEGSAVEPGPPGGVIEIWDEVEPLAAYVDRRLLQAEVLYLPNRGRLYHVAKRTIDVVGATLLLLLAAPVMAVLAVMIRLDSPGPAVFRQQRVTLGGRVFTFYKFRTMWVDARERYPDLYDYRRTGTLGDIYYKLEDDPRNTRVGTWLRRTTLDELPNLVNVLKGDMSLVGPRPERPHFVERFQRDVPAYASRHLLHAGMTGWAQVNGWRGDTSIARRLECDLYYLRHWSLGFDLRILWMTAAGLPGAVRRAAAGGALDVRSV